jgi:outer membrane protein assembly factor BamB
MKPFFAITVFCIFILFASANAAADGPAWKFRSDLSNSGVYDDGGVTPDGTLLWKYSTGREVRSCPAIVNGVVYVGSNDGNLYALDAQTGGLIWNSVAGLGIQSSPAVTDGVVYAGSWDSNVYAFDMSSGALLWNYTTGDAVISSPAVADGIVYVGSFDGNLYALDAASGDPVWQYATAGPRVGSSPAVADGVLYVGSEDGNLYAFNASNGALLWNYTAGGPVHSSPSVANGAVYVGSDDNNVYALDASTGSLLWTYTTGDTVRSSPAVADGIVYVGSYDENVYALNASTGALLWSYLTGDEVDSSPAVANGVVYVGTLGFETSFYALDAETGELLWDYSMGEWFVYSDPAVADGIVYVGCDDGNLYAIGSSTEEPPAYDDFNDNVPNSAIWAILEYGGPETDETNQQLEITLPADSSGDNFYAGYTSNCVLSGDFDVQVDYHLINWPSNNGVRAGLWIERSPYIYTVERASYGISDGFAPGDHYTTNFADSILLSVTNDTDGKLRLIRTGTTFEGYYFDDISHDWVLSQSIQGEVISSRDVTFMIRAWSHDYAFSDELVKVGFDNFVINKGDVIDPRITPPSGITDLHNTTSQPNLIRWTWADPGEPDFDHVMVYLDGVFRENVTNGAETWTASGLAPSTAYTIGTRTVGEMGAINGTWVNHTATTSALSISNLDPPSVAAGSPGFTLNVYGTAFSGNCSVLWNGDGQPTRFLAPDHLSIEITEEKVQNPRFVNITVQDSATGEVSNTVFFLVRDQLAGTAAWKFRSDSSNSGVYDDGGIRPGNELLWKYNTESYLGSSPVVVDRVVYICGIHDTNAIDAFTGKLLWSSPDGGGMSSPAVADNAVYVGSSDRNISALDASTGALLWKYRTGGIVYSSPALYDGVVYAGSWDYNLYALDASTGTLLWNYPTGDEVRSSPAVKNGIVYFGSSDSNVYALDANTGALLWKYTTGGELSSSSPAIANGVVYIKSNDGNLYALDATTGARLWNYPVTGWGDSSPAVADGVVYIGSDDGNLYALDAVSGALIWDFSTGALVRSSPSVANGVVYFGNSGGNLYALDACSGDLLWIYTTDEQGFSSPAIANGVVYAQGYNGFLYALTTFPDDPPESVTDLHATTVNGAEITWAWTDPETLGFSHVMVYLDGVFQENITAGTVTWTAEGFSPSTAYTIGTKTVGVKGAINATLVTDTATTGTLSISTLDPAGVVEDSPEFTLNVHGAGYTPTCAILWNGDEQVTQYLQSDLISMEVRGEYVTHSRRVDITVHDSASGESSNSVILPVTDNPATAKARKFRSDLNNSGVYNDGGRRPAPTLLWTYTTGATVSSSPSIVDGTVYIGSLDRNLYALDATTGAFLWKYEIEERNDYVSSSPAVSNGVVYIGGLKTKIRALDAYSGALLWNYKLPIRTTMRSSVSSSAAVADGVVFIGNMDGTLYAFSEETGDLLWNHAFTPSQYDEHRILSSPAVAGGVVYVNTYGGGLYALDASTGAVLWNYSAEGEYGAYSSLAVADGVVYVGSGYTNKKLYAVDALTGDLLWDFTTGGSVSSSPAVANGVVFLGSNDNTTYALDATTGDLLWNFTTGDRVISSPAVANGVVYFGSHDNNTYALDANTGALLWSYNVGGNVVSSPAVADGIVYVGSGDGKVYAIGTLPVDPPVAEFSANATSGDAPLQVMFTDTSTGVVTTRFWDFGDGTTAWANDTPSISHTYLFPGTFTVSLTAANADGQDTGTKTDYIQVSPTGRPPRALFGISSNIGQSPLTVKFTDHSLGSPTGWQWDFGDGDTSLEQNPTHVYATAGKYTPRLTASNAGGTSTYRSFIWVRTGPVTPTPTIFPTKTVTPTSTIIPPSGGSPIALFAMNTSIGFAPMTVQFTDGSFRGPTAWLWNFGDGGNSTLRNPNHTFLNPGTYPVSLSVSNENGRSNTTRNVYVR